MKRFIAVLFVAVVLAVSGSLVFAAGVTPVKVSLVPTIGIPEGDVVHGLDLGIIADGVNEVQGLQLCWIYGGTSEKLVGIGWSFVDLGKTVEGVQFGFYNSAENMTGLQWGFINVTNQMNGVQIGLLNFIRSSKLPFMVIANAKFK
jgi:hypothetical protein